MPRAATRSDGEACDRWVFVLSAACMAVPSFGAAGGYSILISLYSFEFLCGVFWPSKGILKSQYVPEEV